MEKQDVAIKIVILGNSGVGKTAMFQTYKNPKIKTKTAPTLGMDFDAFHKEIIINNVLIDVKVQIWDTAGQERFRAISPSYVRDADCALLVFEAPQNELDHNAYQTLLAVKEWHEVIVKHINRDREKMTCALCMSKCDRLQAPYPSKLIEHSDHIHKAVCKYGNDSQKLFKTSTNEPSGITKMFDNLIYRTVLTKLKESPPQLKRTHIRRASSSQFILVTANERGESYSTPRPTPESLQIKDFIPLDSNEEKGCCT